MQTITKHQVKNRLDRGESLYLIDLQDPEGYEDSHLPKAINVPFGSDFTQRLCYAFPNRNAEYVVYSHSDRDAQLAAAVHELRKAGYTRVLTLEEGKIGWRRAGLPTAC